MLRVNVASRCGYTPQYAGLQDLYDRYRERGFVILGFPANDFGSQEPGTDAEIAKFCEKNYGVSFPMFSKIHVVGPEIHPLYARLASLPEPLGGAVAWNFEKVLIDRKGHAVARFRSAVAPGDPSLVRAVETLLEADPDLAEPR